VWFQIKYPDKLTPDVDGFKGDELKDKTGFDSRDEAAKAANEYGKSVVNKIKTAFNKSAKKSKSGSSRSNYECWVDAVKSDDMSEFVEEWGIESREWKDTKVGDGDPPSYYAAESFMTLVEKGNEGGWIGVDLDGTLAHGGEWKGEEHVGKAIPEMVKKVKAALKAGKTVKIFTARASDLSAKGKKAIEDFCEKEIGEVLEITNEKDPNMVELWDDRAKQVEKNTGEFVECLLEKKDFDNVVKPPALKSVMDGVSLGKDSKGFFVYTHRARSKSYETAEKIPKSVIAQIESTG